MTSPSSSLPLPLPNLPGLEGVGLHLQVVWFDAAANPLIQLSNGVQLVLGPAAPH